MKSRQAGLGNLIEPPIPGLREARAVSESYGMAVSITHRSSLDLVCVAKSRCGLASRGKEEVSKDGFCNLPSRDFFGE